MEQQIEINEVETKASALPAQVQSLGLKIEDEATLKRVNDAKLYVRKVRAKIKGIFEPMKTAAYASYKGILNKWKEIEAPAIEAEGFCDMLLSDYFAEQRRKREEAERARQAEIQKQKEEEERRLQEALKAEIEGDKEKAEQIINETAEQENNYQSAVIVPEKPKLDKIHSRLDYDVEIVNEADLPRKYLMANMPLLRSDARESKGKAKIPGVRIIVKEIVVTRET